MLMLERAAAETFAIARKSWTVSEGGGGEAMHAAAAELMLRRSAIVAKE